MRDEESRDALHSVADATGTLRDGVDDFLYLPDRTFREAELHETGLAQRAFISAPVANSGNLGVGLRQIGAFLGGQADNRLVCSGKLKQGSRKTVLHLGCALFQRRVRAVLS
jgi:hypothetical protein